ncbi:MAG: hypothetical protein H8D23_20135 [Candidatus Brocadiales bacterium]|nr:hypothetical protein [Candidatus Brocadiales bacterium]
MTFIQVLFDGYLTGHHFLQSLKATITCIINKMQELFLFDGYLIDKVFFEHYLAIKRPILGTNR